MKNEKLKQEFIDDEAETVSENSEQYTSNNTSKEASGQNIDDIPDIDDVLPNSGVFSYPLLEEFLEDTDIRPCILNEVEFVTGQYGPCVGLKLDDTWYRSSSKPILEETGMLEEKELIPCKVKVSRRRGKTGRNYYTLRGGKSE